MKFLLAMGFALLTLWAVAAKAASPPAEAPPPDFVGAQYIDSQGCVFARDGAGWTARLDRDGNPICGYPPTYSARRLVPEGDPLAPLSGRGPQGMEEALADALAEGLRDGELQGDDRPRAAIEHKPVPPPRSGELAALPAMIESLPAIRQASFGGGRPNDRLCDLLGPAPVSDIRPSLGGDPTQGLCGPLVHLDLPHVQDKIVLAGDASEVAPRPAVDPVRAGTAKPRIAGAHSATAAVPGRVGDRTSSKPAAQKELVEMVPHWARFVQIGRYRDDASADAAMGRLRAIGYPVARSHAAAPHPAERLVLAGPFSDRARLIAALADLRKRGYAAVPR